MRLNASWTVASLLTILLTLSHVTHDIVLGMEPAQGLGKIPFLLVLALWLYATLALCERRSGYLIVLILSLLATGVPVVHMIGTRGVIGRAEPGSAGAFVFAWTLLALSVTSFLAVALSARGLWSLRGSPSRIA